MSENITPPTITTPNGIRLVLASPNDNAMGSEPNAMAKLVINIGRSLLSYFDGKLGA